MLAQRYSSVVATTRAVVSASGARSGARQTAFKPARVPVRNPKPADLFSGLSVNSPSADPVARRGQRVTTGVGPRFDAVVSRPPPTEGMGMNHVLFVEIGMGADQHGQDATKAAVRACRNAIEFNSIPSIRQIVPGGYDNMKLHIQIGVPKGAVLDLEKIRRVFPYGQICEPIEVVEGGLMARSGIKIPEMGDKSDEFVIAVAAITIGY